MNKKKEKIVISIVLVMCVFLALGIFKMNKYYDDKHQEEIALEREERAKEAEKLEKIELEKEKEEERKRKERLEKKRLEFREQAEKRAEEMKAQGIDPKAGTGEVPEPEIKIETDENGNKITVTKVPKINPNSSPNDVEKPSKQDPIPTKAPAEKPDAKVEKPYSPRVEGGNETVYPNTKPSEENKNNTNTGKTGNPFLDTIAEPTTDNEVHSKDLLPEGEKMGHGDKF